MELLLVEPLASIPRNYLCKCNYHWPRVSDRGARIRVHKCSCLNLASLSCVLAERSEDGEGDAEGADEALLQLPRVPLPQSLSSRSQSQSHKSNQRVLLEQKAVRIRLASGKSRHLRVDRSATSSAAESVDLKPRSGASGTRRSQSLANEPPPPLRRSSTIAPLFPTQRQRRPLERIVRSLTLPKAIDDSDELSASAFGEAVAAAAGDVLVHKRPLSATSDLHQAERRSRTLDLDHLLLPPSLQQTARSPHVVKPLPVPRVRPPLSVGERIEDERSREQRARALLPVPVVRAVSFETPH